jgi:hypothetical protein
MRGQCCVGSAHYSHGDDGKAPTHNPKLIATRIRECKENGQCDDGVVEAQSARCRTVLVRFQASHPEGETRTV